MKWGRVQDLTCIKNHCLLPVPGLKLGGCFFRMTTMHSSAQLPAKTGPQGLEWVLLRLLPVVGFIGAVIPLAGVGLTRGVLRAHVDAARLEVFEFWLMGVTVVYWSVFMTILVGCAIAWAFRRGKTMLFAPPPADLP